MSLALPGGRHIFMRETVSVARMESTIANANHTIREGLLFLHLVLSIFLQTAYQSERVQRFAKSNPHVNVDVLQFADIGDPKWKWTSWFQISSKASPLLRTETSTSDIVNIAAQVIASQRNAFNRTSGFDIC